MDRNLKCDYEQTKDLKNMTLNGQKPQQMGAEMCQILVTLPKQSTRGIFVGPFGDKSLMLSQHSNKLFGVFLVEIALFVEKA